MLKCTATHDIIRAMVTETHSNVVVITTLYSDKSDARGALFSFVFIDDDGAVNFTHSALVTLDRTSSKHVLPFNLFPGLYTVFVYDIEQDGILSSGVGYPAVTTTLSTRGDNQSKQLACMVLNLHVL